VPYDVDWIVVDVSSNVDVSIAVVVPYVDTSLVVLIVLSMNDVSMRDVVVEVPMVDLVGDVSMLDVAGGVSMLEVAGDVPVIMATVPYGGNALSTVDVLDVLDVLDLLEPPSPSTSVPTAEEHADASATVPAPNATSAARLRRSVGPVGAGRARRAASRSLLQNGHATSLTRTCRAQDGQAMR
jgi:hypothetical protein